MPKGGKPKYKIVSAAAHEGERALGMPLNNEDNRVIKAIAHNRQALAKHYTLKEIIEISNREVGKATTTLASYLADIKDIKMNEEKIELTH